MIIEASQISRERGFAFVELIVIVALVCILVAFAVPRFVTLEVEVRSAATTSLGGDLRSQAAHAHALWLAQGQPDVIVMNDERIAMQHGYPAASAIAHTLADIDGFVLDIDSAELVVSKSGDGSGAIANCSVRYAGAVDAVSAPLIRIDTSGC
jgi:MSHA pilin protein MshA